MKLVLSYQYISRKCEFIDSLFLQSPLNTCGSDKSEVWHLFMSSILSLAITAESRQYELPFLLFINCNKWKPSYLCSSYAHPTKTRDFIDWKQSSNLYSTEILISGLPLGVHSPTLHSVFEHVLEIRQSDRCLRWDIFIFVGSIRLYPPYQSNRPFSLQLMAWSRVPPSFSPKAT